MYRNACVATGSVMLALTFGGSAAAAGLAQVATSAAGAATPGEAVTLEPIECGWRASTGAIRAGELFTLVLTCSVVETASTTVVPDRSRLDPGVLQISPFEVVRGAQANDVRTGTRRFFQYEYTLRYVGEDFGKDVSLPPLTVSYRVQSRVQQDAALEGRERQYILPALVIRILSLVPAVAANIRDQPADSLRQIETRRLRANVFRVIAGSLYVVGAFVVMSGLMRALRTRRRQTPAATALASDGAILRRVSEELDQVRRLRASAGWLDALAGRALAALRVVATFAVSHPVTQVRGHGIRPADGQLVVPGRWPGRNETLVSSSMTPVTLAAERRRIEDAGTGGARRLADLDGAMNRFAARAYGRDAGAIDDAALDAALDAGARALDQLRREHTWLATKRRAMVASLVRLKPDNAGGAARV